MYTQTKTELASSLIDLLLGELLAGWLHSEEQERNDPDQAWEGWGGVEGGGGGGGAAHGTLIDSAPGGNASLTAVHLTLLTLYST